MQAHLEMIQEESVSLRRQITSLKNELLDVQSEMQKLHSEAANTNRKLEKMQLENMALIKQQAMSVGHGVTDSDELEVLQRHLSEKQRVSLTLHMGLLMHHLTVAFGSLQF